MHRAAIEAQEILDGALVARRAEPLPGGQSAMVRAKPSAPCIGACALRPA